VIAMFVRDQNGVKRFDVFVNGSQTLGDLAPA
jgi:hypothetical protein